MSSQIDNTMNITKTDVKIIYTKTDEAPALATYSLFPIIKAFLSLMKIPIEIKDISLASRILACFPHLLKFKTQDALMELAELVQTPLANIIKLPNISASLPQLKIAIEELQKQGFDIPSFPEDPDTPDDKDIYLRYKKVLGSAVNPVLREGNSDRRVPKPIKQYVKKHPHSMKQWDSNSPSHVASMEEGDFYANEQSMVIPSKTYISIKFIGQQDKILKSSFCVLKEEIIDATFMSKKSLCHFFEREITDAYQKELLLSLHLKSTMMKISDPIIFSEAIRVYFKEAINQYSCDLDKIDVDFRNGLSDLFFKIKTKIPSQQETIINAFLACYKKRPALAMVDSQKGITHLHNPNDVIIDSSMPSMIKYAGNLQGPDGQLHPTKALIPDRSYAGLYQQVIEFCKVHGAFDPKTMGSVSNIGLMAKKAQEYGSHDKTYKIPSDGKIQIMDDFGNVLLEHKVQKGDIWRMCQTKDEAISNWVQLAVKRARATRQLTIFWLDHNRSHDRYVIQKVKQHLKDQNTNHLDIRILSPIEAMKLTLQEVSSGKDIIAVTGNVLRDYLTDLFPILEVGTSSKMLSIVPLLKGGGLYETGAGGTAPRHVQQFLKENHLRWDSLGEFLALAVSLEDLSNKVPQFKLSASVLASALNRANQRFLEEKKSPLRQVHQLDTRGSHFYLSMYWAEAIVEKLSEQQHDDLKSVKEQCHFVACQLKGYEEKILEEINSQQGRYVDIKGYYHPDEQQVTKVMRPSATFNSIIDQLLDSKI